MVPRGKALLLHGGALGDCLFTLRLAEFLKSRLRVNRIDFYGQMRNISLLPGRSHIDRVKDIESLNLARLFLPSAKFELDDERLINDFGGYDWIISFLGESGSDFEQNLAVTACVTSAPELVILPAKAPEDYDKQISQFHLEEFINRKLPSIEAFGVDNPHKFIHQEHESLITPTLYDVVAGHNILRAAGLNRATCGKLAVISPGSGGEFKNWHLSNFIELSDKLKANGFTCVFLLGYVEEESFSEQCKAALANAAPVLRNLGIDQVLALLSCCELFIGNDSGVGHLSALCGLPTLSIFGPTNHTHYRPIGGKANFTAQPAESFTSHCPECVDAVLRAALELTNRTS
jgi:hypothetical protein